MATRASVKNEKQYDAQKKKAGRKGGKAAAES